MTLHEPPREARKKYQIQRGQAKLRGIAWEFTLESWWQVWASSGKWEQRGRGSEQYQMARNGDAGPYSPSNVRIVTHAENNRERLANGLGPLGKGKGWKRNARCKTRPFEARIAGKHLGVYATEQEAEAAYRQAASLLLEAGKA
jgi:hypothetical protein